MSRLIARLPAVAVTAGASVLLATGPAAADAPSAQGWWIATNPGALPEIGAAPATVPAAPDVPADGLLVQGGQDPTVNPDAVALAALVYDVAPGDAPLTLTLATAPGTVTTPGAALKLCPLVVPVLRAEQGGPMSEAPDYACSTSVSATVTPAGTFAFDVAKLVHGPSFGVAILPSGPSDRVVLRKPGPGSLAVRTTVPSASPSSATAAGPSPGPSVPPTSAAPAPQDTPAPVGLTDGGAGALPAPDVPAELATADAPAPVVAGQPTQAADAGAAELVPASTETASPRPASPGSSRWPAGALCAGLLLAAVLWAYAGRGGEPLPDEVPEQA